MSTHWYPWKNFIGLNLNQVGVILASWNHLASTFLQEKTRSTAAMPPITRLFNLCHSTHPNPQRGDCTPKESSLPQVLLPLRLSRGVQRVHALEQIRLTVHRKLHSRALSIHPTLLKPSRDWRRAFTLWWHRQIGIKRATCS